MKKVGIIGITGKVGSIVAKLVSDDADLELIGGTSSKSQASDFENLAKNSDVLIDFSGYVVGFLIILLILFLVIRNQNKKHRIQ